MSQENDHWGTLPENIPVQYRPAARVSLWQWLKDLFGPLGSPVVIEPTRPAPPEPVERQMLRVLESIDKRLATLESTVRPGARHRTRTPHIVTGHWND